MFHYASVDFCDQPVISQQNIAGRNINLQSCGLPVIAFSACSETAKSLGLPKETTMSCTFRYEQINLFRSRQFERKNTYMYEDVATYHFFYRAKKSCKLGELHWARRVWSSINEFRIWLSKFCVPNCDGCAAWAPRYSMYLKQGLSLASVDLRLA